MKFIYRLFSISFLCLIKAQAEENPIKPSEEVPIKCTKEELITFFPQQVVESTLLKAKVPREQSTAIAKAMSSKDLELNKVIENKASQLEPNPYKNLSYRDLAVRIHRETLYEAFSKVMKEHGITDEDQIQTLSEEIQAAKSKLFIDCIRKQHHSIPPPDSP